MVEGRDKFSKLLFELPELWALDWKDLIETSEGERRAIFSSLAKTTASLHKASKWRPSAETLAWITLWSRNWVLSISAIGALDSKSPLLLEILWRAAFELNLQLSAIINPNAPGVLPVNKLKNEEIIGLKDRLCAYTAWALVNDQKYLSSLLRKNTLKQIYNIDKEYDEQTEATLEPLNVALWGDAERPIVGKDAAEERRKTRENLFSRRNKIIDLLADAKLKNWRNRIEIDKPRTFFSLLSKFDSSIMQRIKSIGFEFATALYDRPSSLLHGSTIEGFVDLSGPNISPEAAISQVHAEREASNIRRYCHNNGFALEAISLVLDSSPPK